MRGAQLVLLLLLPLLAEARTQPGFTLKGNVVSVALPASVLQHASVRKQLATGLTTTFIVIARSRDRTTSGAARLEIRYDLWDEVYHVKRMDLDRIAAVASQRLASLEALEQWWKTQTRIVDLKTDRVVLDVDLRVLPFSGAEEADARAWLSRSGGISGPAGEGANSLVDVLIGTTISARPIVSFRWSAEVVRR